MTTETQTIEAASTVETPQARRPVIRPVEANDGPALHRLLVENIPDVIPDRSRWLARWNWQCWANPFRSGRPAGWVLADGERVLGHLGAVYVPLWVNGVRVTGAIGVDYAIDGQAAAQGGLFAALELAGAFFKSSVDCLPMATTANDKTAAVFGRFGCRPVGWPREFWRAPATLHQQLRSCYGGSNRLLRRVINSRFGPVAIRLTGFMHRLAQRAPAQPLSRGWWLETTVPQLARDLGSLGRDLAAAHAAETTGGLKLDRSAGYLNWRFVQHPERDKCRVLVVRDAEGRPLGAAIVFRELRADRHLACLEDVLVLPGRQDVLRALLCAALRLACNQRADYLVTSPGMPALRSVFWELGFESRARNAPAAILALAPAQPIEGVALPDPPDNHVEFWHGMMF